MNKKNIKELIWNLFLLVVSIIIIIVSFANKNILSILGWFCVSILLCEKTLEQSKNEKEETIIRDYIKSCSDNCYCKLVTRCDNCIGKEHIIEIIRLLEKGSKNE